jgi:starch synthase (maltosyl-transferring)
VRERGMELALDIAFQCTPDHVWVTEHPEWFKHRADGTIQYAENPPKKYQDIYPIDFETEDWQGLWDALADVFRFWIEQGVTIFRVDNPHTKAFRVLGVVHRVDPRRAPRDDLPRRGVHPATRDGTAGEARLQPVVHVLHLAAGGPGSCASTTPTSPTRTVDYYRPNSWPNTPDILTEQLQHGGRAMFVSRAILAATLSANWGIYGPAFELLEHRPSHRAPRSTSTRRSTRSASGTSTTPTRSSR